MESLEVSAKTVEEAIEQALTRLGANRSEAEIEVLNEGRSGILGFGAEESRVRVTLLSSPSLRGADVARVAEGVLENLLQKMKINATVALKEPSAVDSPGRLGPVAFDISCEDPGILIGRRGETLAALQTVVNVIVGRQLKSRTSINVDVEGYRQRREDSLRGLARRMADRVRATRQSITLEPMPSNERRIIHLSLQQQPDIVTRSLGDGENRKVTIALRVSDYIETEE